MVDAKSQSMKHVSCNNCRQDFEITEDDLGFYEKLVVPPPKACWDCRFARLLVWRNERSLYKRPCDLCKKDMICMYRPGTPFSIYCRDCYISDKWDPTEYGREYDPAKSFFEQFAELQKVTPRPNLNATDNINSDYCNFTSHQKNCYLMFGSWFNENCGYGQTVLESKDCWDCIFVKNSEGCMHSIDCTKCYQTHFSQNCVACSDSAFLYDCKNCQNCLFSYNLRNKTYHAFNRPVSKEEYKKIKETAYIEENFLKFRKEVAENAIHKFMTGEQNQNVSGDFIYHSKNVHKSFYIHNGENEKYAVRGGKGQKDSMDVFGVHAGELAYSCINADFSSRIKFVISGENNVDAEYLIDCYSTENSFGCISLRKKKYCILNRQYDEEAYKALREKIIANMSEYGEFFPMSMSPFAYNETIAQEYMPLTKETAPAWYDIPEKDYQVGGDIILCQAWAQDKEKAKEYKCTKAFRITPTERGMYERFGIPLPTKCPNTRFYEKFQMRNPVKFYNRTCSSCGKEIETTYSPERKEMVYCQQCYQCEIV